MHSGLLAAEAFFAAKVAWDLRRHLSTGAEMASAIGISDAVHLDTVFILTHDQAVSAGTFEGRSAYRRMGLNPFPLLQPSVFKICRSTAEAFWPQPGEPLSVSTDV